MLSFEKTKIGELELRNRIIMAPMCMFNADESGRPNNFHTIHYGNAALGGLGLIIVEATGVVPEGRISDRDLGIWSDSQIAGHSKIVEVAHEFGAKVGIQLAHAGRKCEIEKETIVAPSAIAFSEDYKKPVELDAAGIKRVKDGFREGALRAVEAGYDLIEVHGAHGYLLHQFLSPLSNQRTDEYGGSRENRARLVIEVAEEIRSVIPKEMPMILRVSATDYYEGGIDIDEMVELVNLFKHLFDVIHVSSGALVSDAVIKPYPGYQVPFSEAIKTRCDVRTIAVGLLTQIEQIEEVLANGRADYVALGRVLLREPYFLLNNGRDEIEIHHSIRRGFPSLPKGN